MATDMITMDPGNQELGVVDAFAQVREGEEVQRGMARRYRLAVDTEDLRDVLCADDGDEKAARRVQGNGETAYLLDPRSKARPESRNANIGLMLARKARAGVWDLYQDMAARRHLLEDQQGWKPNDYARRIGEMWQEDERQRMADEESAYQDFQGKVQHVDTIMPAYLSGAGFRDAEGDDAGRPGTYDEYALTSESERALFELNPELGVKARQVREDIQQLFGDIRPGGDYEDVAGFMDRLEGMQDFLMERIGEDQELAQLYFYGLMGLARQWSDTRGASAGDEFLQALGQKVDNWTSLAPVAGNLMIAGQSEDVEAINRAQENMREAMEERERTAPARRMLAAAKAQAMEVGNASPWEAVLREYAKMGGDTLPYLTPGIGMALGTADTMVAAGTQGVDAAMAQYAFGGNPQGYESEGAAAADVMLQGAIGAAVEFGAGRVVGKVAGLGAGGFGVGGKGLAASLRSVAERGAMKVGAISERVAGYSMSSFPRALAAEAGAAVLDEAVIEPVTQGMLQYGTGWLMDQMGVPHGKARAFADCFDELQQIWGGDRTTLGGLMLFCGTLAGARSRGLYNQVKWFALNKENLGAAGAPNHVVAHAMEIKDIDKRVEYVAGEMQRCWTEDPEGTAQRMLAENRRLAEAGKALAYTGKVADAEINPGGALDKAYQASWQRMEELGWVPHVEAVADGKFRVTRSGKGLQGDLDVTTTAQGADVLLRSEIDRAEQAYYRATQQKLKVRGEVAQLAGDIAGEAATRAVKEHGGQGMKHAALEELLPADIVKQVKARGYLSEADMQDLLAYTEGVLDGAAGVADTGVLDRWKAAGIADSFGDMQAFARQLLTDWGSRKELAGGQAVGTTAFRTPQNAPVEIDGRKMLGSTVLTLGGRASSTNVLEEVVETYLDQVVQARAAELTDADDAAAAAWREVGDVVSRVREQVLKMDPKAKVEEVDASRPMSIIEAFSTLAMSEYLTSPRVPDWMRGVQAAMKGCVSSAGALEGVRVALDTVDKAAPEVAGKFRELLDSVEGRVATLFERTRVEERDVEAWRHAVGLVEARVNAPGMPGGASVSRVVAEAEDEERAIREREEAEPIEREEKPAAVEAHAGQVLAAHGDPTAPDAVRRCFVGGNCVHNESGNYYVGLVAKGDIREGAIQQVKVGEKGAHGVIAGRELTGDFESTAAPLYLWLRKNGELQLISGRHRFAKLMEDTNVQSHLCYVFVEGESFAGVSFDEKWARMLDYENNMRDDQADEVTAGTYARETGHNDEYMRRKGLLRNASRSKRGIFIGRQAGDELWTRFANGAVSPKDAEIICQLTAPIKDRTRVADIQTTCCTLLDQKKSWEYIGAMAQLLANKEAVTLKQGLLDLGADFEADMDRMARFVEKNLQSLSEAISVLKGDRKLAKKGSKATRLGVSAQLSEEEREQRIADLERIKAEFELIGSNPELIAQAQLWDGKTELDPVARYLEQAQAAREQEARESGMDADEYLEEQAAKRAAAEAVPSLFGSMSVVNEEELASIRAAAVEAGTFMKAPNGADTNLTERQWLQVRTRAFKDWFGDWEHDPKHASKVLDENGEPLVVYHGTPKGGFKEFKEESYFTPHRAYAERYVHAGGKGNIWGVSEGEPSMYELFLNIRKPFDTRTKADASIFEREFLGKWGNNTPLSERGLPDWTDAADMLEFLEERGGGYDGVIIDEGGDPDANGNPVWRGVSYLTTSPTQIKSATDNRGTFDGRKADITFSVAIPETRVCATRKEAISMVGRKGKGKPLRLYNAYFDFEAEFSQVSEGKFANGDSVGVSFQELEEGGVPDDIKAKVFWTAFGNVEQLFANADRRHFERAYKRKDERKGFLHMFTPFTIDGIDGEFESEIYVMILQQKGERPKAYVLQVRVQKNKPLVSQGVVDETAGHPQQAAVNIEDDFPELVKRKNSNGISFSTVAGQRNLAAVHTLDAAYMKAVESGDMATAAKMVQEAAHARGYFTDVSYQGSQAFNGAAPSGGMYETTAERVDAWEQGEFEGDITLEDFAKRKMDPGNLKWQVTDEGNYARADKETRESIDAVRQAMRSKGKMVTIYRAVPGDVVEGSVRNGDWVTLSKSYAELHLTLQDWESGRVIKQKVPMDNVWWDGNDINEWGYDDGRNYAYRNTRHNRKLMDAVTYDADGKVIPLSQRFNPDKPDISFSVARAPRNLAAVHTLDAGKLKEAAALGGMPMPSIAVTRLDRPYDWGRGEVALVGAPGMVDPQAGTDVYSGDAWTVMFPYLKRIVTGEASRRASAEMIREMASQYQDPKRTSALGVFARVVDPDSAEAAGADPYMLHRHLTSVEGKALYAYEHGKRVKVRTRHKNYEYTWITEEMLNELAPLVEKHGGMPRGEDARKFADVVERTIRKHEMERIEQLDVEESKRAHYLEGFMKPYANMLEAWREGHDFRMNGEMIAGNVLERNATEIDEPGTLEALGKYADRHKRDYAKWVADKEAAWYSREQYIKRTGKLATLDNLTEEMLKDIGANGSTDWLGFSPSQLRAGRSVRFKSLDEISGMREKISDQAHVKESRERADELISDICAEASRYGEGNFMYQHSRPDLLLKSLGEVKGKPTNAKVRRALAKAFDWADWYGELVTDTYVEQCREALEALQDELVQYMEAKPRRAVTLDEWQYAVMPDALKKDRELKGLLKANGIKAVWHDGTDEGRRAAFASLVDSGIAFSTVDMEVASTRALALLEGRADEAYAVEMAKRFRRKLEQLQLFRLGDERDEALRLGRGAQLLAELTGLVDSAEAVLGQAAHTGRLAGLLRWCKVYAQMMQEGRAPAGGELKGGLYDEFTARMRKMQEGAKLNGLTDDEVRETMASYAGERLDAAFDKVARHVVECMDGFVKARARERMDYIHEHVYPKREEGQKWPRGKMSADAYRRVERVYQLMEMDSERVATLIESAKRELAELQAEGVEDEEQRKREAELEDELALLSLYGDWEHKSAQEATRAAAAFADDVLHGRREWDERLRAERRRLAWERREIQSHFRGSKDEQLARVARENAAASSSDLKAGGRGIRAFMNFSHLLHSLEKKLGKRWTTRMRRGLADIHTGMMQGNQELQEWLLTNVREVTGLTSEMDMQSWLEDAHELYDTGITLELPGRTGRCRMTPAEAYAWLRMSREEREARREELQAEFDERRELPDNVPTEEQIEELRHKVASSYVARTARGKELLEEAKKEAREMKVRRALEEREAELGRMLTREETAQVRREASQLSKEEWTEVRENVLAGLMLTEDMEAEHQAEGVPQHWELKGNEANPQKLYTSKANMLQAVLTFEQPDYEHLMEPNGITPAILWEMKKQIGPKLLELGYRMRERLNENGEGMAEVYERLTGIPFGFRANYYRGVFDVNKAAQLGEAVDRESGSALPSGKHGMLIPRRYHMSRIPWTQNVSALSVFLDAMRQQTRYTLTAEYIHDARGLLERDSDFKQALAAEIGEDASKLMTDWLHLVEGAQIATTKWGRVAQYMLGKAMRGSAIAYLAFNLGTYLKQSTAILNCFIGGYIPDKLGYEDGRVQVLAERGIKFLEMVDALGRVASGKGHVTLAELKADPMFKSRAPGEGNDLMESAQLGADRKSGTRLGKGAKRVAELGMKPIYMLDIFFNKGGAAVLYEATWASLERNDPQGKLTAEDKDRVCRETLRTMLDFAAQPVLRTQMSYHAAAKTLGGIGQMLFLFRSEGVKNFGVMLSQLANGEYGRAAFTMLGLGVMVAAAMQVIDWLRGYSPDDEDEDRYWKMGSKFVLDSLTNDLTSVPGLEVLVQNARWGVEEAISAVSGANVVTPEYRSASAPRRMVNAVKREVKNIEQGAPWQKHVRAVAQLAKIAGPMASFGVTGRSAAVADAATLAWTAAACGNLARYVADVYDRVMELATGDEAEE